MQGIPMYALKFCRRQLIADMHARHPVWQVYHEAES